MSCRVSLPSHLAVLKKLVWLCAGIQPETCLDAWLRRTKWLSLILGLPTQSVWPQVIKVLVHRSLLGSTMKPSSLQVSIQMRTENLQFGIWRISTSRWQRAKWVTALVSPISTSTESMTSYLMLEEVIQSSSTGSLIALLHVWWLLSTNTLLEQPPKLSAGYLNGLLMSTNTKSEEVQE